MNFDDSFSKRVAIARKAIGLTQAELAKMVGVVPRQIAAYEGGEARPRINALHNLAAALGTTVDWLTTGSGHGPNTNHIKRTVTVREIPLLTHAQVNGIGFDFDDFRNSSSACDFIPAPPDAGEYAFAFEVHGESMESSSGTSFPDGTIIIVDPESMPNNGDYALFVDLMDSSLIFRQYIIDQEKEYLKPLNQNYPVMPKPAEISTIGKVISSQQFFKSSQIASSGSVANDTNEKNKKYHEINERILILEEKIDSIINLLSGDKKPT